MGTPTTTTTTTTRTTNTTLTTTTTNTIDIDNVGVGPPGLNRRISTKILYQEERLREQIRQAEQREKLAKKQANTQRIENERLEQAIAQWKKLITAKDEELEALEADVDLLR